MKIDNPANHLDQLIRQTRWHHAQLSMMADNKANMMLTAPALVLTLAVPRLAEPEFRWAAATLILSCLVTVVLAAVAATPGRSRPGGPDSNLLFFDGFAHMSYAEFEQAMEEVLNDPARTYEAQVREIYTLGRYLARKKYRYVRYAYVTFTGGLLLSAAVFLAGQFAAS